jgi:hypothetical protein
VTSLVGKPSWEGAAAKHYPGSAPSIDTGGRGRDPEAGRGQRRLAQLLVLAATTLAPAAAGDCFGTTCREGEAGAR